METIGDWKKSTARFLGGSSVEVEGGSIVIGAAAKSVSGGGECRAEFESLANLTLLDIFVPSKSVTGVSRNNERYKTLHLTGFALVDKKTACYLGRPARWEFHHVTC